MNISRLKFILISSQGNLFRKVGKYAVNINLVKAPSATI